MKSPTLDQLARAHVAARLRGPLADALRNPTLARCLQITAIALAAQAHPHEFRPPSAAPPPPTSSVAVSTRINQASHPTRDFKRACAGDKDDE